MRTLEEIKERMRTIAFAEKFDTVVAVASGGIVPAAMLNQRLGLDFHLVKLNRRAPDQTPLRDIPLLLEPLAFDPAGRSILLVEDRVKTGVTLRHAAALLASARLVRTLAVNGPADYPLFDEPCFRFPWIL